MFRYVAAGAIVGYQKYLSPHKGYVCAFRLHTQRCSCSEFARKYVLRHGVLKLLFVLPARFAKCKQAAMALKEKLAVEKGGDNIPPVCNALMCDCAPVGGECCTWPF